MLAALAIEWTSKIQTYKSRQISIFDTMNKLDL